MRRPSPLPSPVPESAPAHRSLPPAGGPTVIDAGRSVVTSDRPAETDAAAEVAVRRPTPIGGGASQPVAASASHPVSPAAPPDPGPPLRARDVWQAARARRKALRAEMRRFTVRQRRRRAWWLGSIGAVVLLVLATLGAAYSPLFAVERVRVVGSAAPNAAAIEAALAGQLGTALPLVDEVEVRAALAEFPFAESYRLEARPPHELVVRIVERTPIGAIRTGSRYEVVDAAGVALATSDSPPEGQPVIEVTGGLGSETFAALGQVMRSLPDAVRAQVTTVTATTPNDVTLGLGATNTTVVWGSADDSAYKAVVLERTMAARPPESVSRYDVSSPSAVVVG